MTTEEFRQALKAIKCSQAQFARNMGVGHRLVNRWATGTSPRPIPRWVSHHFRLHTRNHELETAVEKARDHLIEGDMKAAWEALRV